MKAYGKMLMSMDESQEHAIEITRLLEESNGETEKAFVANLRSHLRKLAIRLHLGTPSAVGQSLSEQPPSTSAHRQCPVLVVEWSSPTATQSMIAHRPS